MAEVQAFVHIVEQPQAPRWDIAAPPTKPNTSPPIPLPPEPRQPVNAVASSVRSSRLDPDLYPELPLGNQTFPDASTTDSRSSDRDPQSVRKNAARVNWQPRQVYWDPTDLSYAPLYFEDPRLERHGHDLGILQPIASSLHFFGTVPALPYLATQQNPNSAVYPLGQTRPGDRIAPYHERPRFDWKAVMAEASTWIGFFALFP